MFQRCITMVLGMLAVVATFGGSYCAEESLQAIRGSAADGTSDAAAPRGRWVRVLRDNRNRPIALQTAIVRYESSESETAGVSVDLIGAIHVADQSYYERLNRQFTQYDALLYELVAPDGTRIDPARTGDSRHPVGAMQNFLKGFLELEHQLGCVDYSRANFVHADMSPDEFARSMAARGESFLQMFFRLMGQSIAQQSHHQAQGVATELDILAALFQEDRALRLKTIVAQQFEQMESLLVGFGGPEGSTLIEGRNQVAMDVLKKQLRAGKKKMGIFYGAGHLADMDKRLREQFHMRPVSVQWLTAWNLSGD